VSVLRGAIVGAGVFWFVVAGVGIAAYRKIGRV
jgi:hypothetical protein